MKLLVLAALAALVVADVSHLKGYSYNEPASSYGVPQNSVTEKQHYFVTEPSVGLHVPIHESQQFNILSSTPAPQLSYESGIQNVNFNSAPSVNLGSGLTYTTAAPNVELSGLGSTTAAPNVEVSGLSFTTAAPHVELSGPSHTATAQNVDLSGLSYTTAAPSIDFSGLSYTTAAPSVDLSGLSYTTAAPSFSFGNEFHGFQQSPSVSFNSGLSGFPTSYNFGLNSFSTPAPLLGHGGITSIDSNLFNSGASVNSVQVQGATSGGSLSDAFGVSTPGPLLSGLGSYYQQSYQQNYQRNPQPAEVSKHLYFFAAPEEPEPRPRINVAPVDPPKKNVKVIFIKAPAPPSPGPIQIAAPAQDQEKTVVYVLVKKPEDQQDIVLQTPPPTAPAKPEVYFIKYKNQKDAEEAISHVQAGQKSAAEGHVEADHIDGGDFVQSIHRDSSFRSHPVVNYVQAGNHESLAQSSPSFGSVSTESPLVLSTAAPAGQFYSQSFSPGSFPNVISSGFAGAVSTESPIQFSTSAPGQFLQPYSLGSFPLGFSGAVSTESPIQFSTSAPSGSFLSQSISSGSGPIVSSGFAGSVSTENPIQFSTSAPSGSALGISSGSLSGSNIDVRNQLPVQSSINLSESDLNQNLISHDFNGIESSTLSPLSFVGGQSLFGSTTAVPYQTYGVPVQKK